VMPRLKAWVHGRIPPQARQILDTDDLVQISLVQALKHMETFEPRHEGAFMAYLRQIAMNRVRDELRRVSRRPRQEELEPDLSDRAPSPIENLVGREALESFDAALQHLTEGQRQAVLLRVEFNYTFEEIAEAMESPSVAAARMLVVRGLARLAEIMNGKR
jgi:RNA polymerase sigma factor (sigma-70 family)